MSLVNDMLRDLDARRRDAPGRTDGMEKLVPATDGAGSGRRSQWLALAAGTLLAAVVVVAVALYLTGTREEREPAPVAETGSSASSASASVTTDAGVPEEGDEATRQQLRALQDRLARLEAENRQQEQPGADVPSPPDSGDAPDVEQPAPPAGPPAVTGRTDEWEPRNWSSSAPQQPGTAQAAAVEGASIGNDTDSEAPATGSAGGPDTRTPRELPFAERDRRQVQEALTLWADGRRTAALEALDRFTVDNPQAHLSREMLGKLLIESAEPRVAMQVAEIGLRIAPMHDGYRKLRARLLMADGRSAEAVTLLDDRPPSATADTEYHELLATAALGSQQYRVAQRSYESLLGTDEGEGRWWYGLAAALDGQGQAGSAVRAYERAQRSGSLNSRLRQRSEERITQLTAP